MINFIQALSFISPLASAYDVIHDTLTKSLANGEISSDEAADIGAAVAGKLGDLRVSIKGVDILDNGAQVDLCRGLARLARNTIMAASGARPKAASGARPKAASASAKAT